MDTIRDPALVAAASGQALGRSESVEHPFGVVLRDFLASRQLLLVLDNFERVLETAELVGDLLSPEIAPILATICEQLDGFPLAIGLAASRVRLGYQTFAALRAEGRRLSLDDVVRLAMDETLAG